MDEELRQVHRDGCGGGVAEFEGEGSVTRVACGAREVVVALGLGDGNVAEGLEDVGEDIFRHDGEGGARVQDGKGAARANFGCGSGVVEGDAV